MNYLAITIILLVLVGSWISFVYGVAYMKSLRNEPLIYTFSDSYTENGLRIVVITLYGRFLCNNVTSVLEMNLLEMSDRKTVYMIVLNTSLEESVTLICNRSYLVKV